MKKIKYLLFAIICIIPITAMAESTTFYVTKTGYELTETQYNNLRTVFTDKELDDLSSTTLDAIKDDSNFGVAENETYFKTDEYTNGLITLTKEYEVTEDEAIKNSDITLMGSSNNSHQTTYKKLNVKVVSSTNNGLNYLTITSTLNWLKEPANKTYDVWATRFDKADCFGLTSSYKTEKKPKGGGSWKVNLNGLPSHVQIKDYGYGSVIGVDKDNLDSRWTVKVLLVSKPNLVRVTYQHAQGKIAFKDTYNFDISSSGYGGVVKFNTSAARNVYDQMGGVSVTPNYN